MRDATVDWLPAWLRNGRVLANRMLRLDRVIKSWKESGALNSQINLDGFWNEHTFITKSGDLGIVLRMQGVDYESLDQI